MSKAQTLLETLWFKVVAKPQGAGERSHGHELHDDVTVVAVTPGPRVLFLRQFRCRGSKGREDCF